MTKLAVKGLATAAGAALQPHVEGWYRRSGCRAVAVVELQHVERMEPAREAEKERAVTMRIAACEVPVDPENEDVLREVMRSLYLLRTAAGTLDEEGQLQLSKQTLRLASQVIGGQAMARLSAGLHHWLGHLARVQANQALTVGELRHEIDAVHDGLAAILAPAPVADDDGEV